MQKKLRQTAWPTGNRQTCKQAGRQIYKHIDKTHNHSHMDWQTTAISEDSPLCGVQYLLILTDLKSS